MGKITFENFTQIMSCDLYKKREPCIEICFDVDGYTDYCESWLGKMMDRDTKNDVYWFGLVPDGSQAYDYDSFEAFVNAKIFNGCSSLKDIWGLISIISLDGGQVEETLSYFLYADQEGDAHG